MCTFFERLLVNTVCVLFAVRLEYVQILSDWLPLRAPCREEMCCWFIFHAGYVIWVDLSINSRVVWLMSDCVCLCIQCRF